MLELGNCIFETDLVVFKTLRANGCDVSNSPASEIASVILTPVLPSLQLVLCKLAAVKVFSYINHSAVYILCWSFEISENLLRNQMNK